MPRLALQRGIWGALVLVVISQAVIATPRYLESVAEPCGELICLQFERPNLSGMVLLERAGISAGGYAMIVTAASWALLLLDISVATLLAWRPRPSLLSVVFAATIASNGAMIFGTQFIAQPGLVGIVALAFATLSSAMMPVAFGVFPTGRWVPGWYRYAVVPLVLASVLVTLSDEFGWTFRATGLHLIAAVAPFAVALGAQVYRFVRVSDWRARQQSKWVLAGVIILAVNLLLATVGAALPASQLMVVANTYLAQALITVGIAAALIQHRLFGADVAVRRSIIYVVAVALTVGVYLGLVVLAGQVLSSSTASLVGTIAAVAAGLGGWLLLSTLTGTLRTRIMGPTARPGGVAAAMARLTPHADDPDPVQPADPASTLAYALQARFLAIHDDADCPVWTTGSPTAPIVREPILGSDGRLTGSVLVGLERGRRRLRPGERRAADEALPLLALLLSARRAAHELDEARGLERRRLRRDLHDHIGPLLAGQLLTIDTWQESVRRGLPSQHLLQHLQEQTRTAITEVRRLSRELEVPTVAVQEDLHQVVSRFRGAGLPVRAEMAIAVEPDASVARAASLILAEALTNVSRHAAAGSTEVRVVGDRRQLELTVADDGVGVGQEVGTGVGTTSILRRARELGGSASIRSAGPAGGTTVHVVLPIATGERR